MESYIVKEIHIGSAVSEIHGTDRHTQTQILLLLYKDNKHKMH